MVPLGLKGAFIEAKPETYFETSHYAGWPAMLVCLDAVGEEDMANRLTCAWLEKAPARLTKAFAQSADQRRARQTWIPAHLRSAK